MELRDYQADGVEGIRDSFNRTRRVMYQLVTGGGKTPVFSYLTAKLLSASHRVLILAHRRELIRQASEKLTRFGVEHGIAQSGYMESPQPCIVGSVQTVVNRLDRMLPPKVIIVDEAHHAVAPTYERIFAAWPDAYVLGVSATPERLDGRGLRDAGFDEMVTGPPMRTLIAQGYLADYDYYAPPVKADIGAVKTRAGDFAKDQLAAVMDTGAIVGDAIGHYDRLMHGAPAFVYCVSVAHAYHVAEAFRARGFRAVAVDGDLEPHERDARIRAFTRGELNVIASCDLIGEGLDVEGAQGMISLRPTKSLIVYLQQIGRAMRPKRDGSRAVLIDHVGNIARFGPPCLDREWTLDGAKKRKPTDGMSTCEMCFHVFPKGQTPRQTGACAFENEECPYLEDTGQGGRSAPEEVDGELAALKIDDRKYDHLPAWAGGLNIATVRGFELKLLLQRCRSIEHLELVRKIRGYNPGWTRIQQGVLGIRK